MAYESRRTYSGVQVILWPLFLAVATLLVMLAIGQGALVTGASVGLAWALPLQVAKAYYRWRFRQGHHVEYIDYINRL